MCVIEKEENNIYTAIKEERKRKKKKETQTCLPFNLPHSRVQAHHNEKTKVMQSNNEKGQEIKRLIDWL